MRTKKAVMGFLISFVFIFCGVFAPQAVYAQDGAAEEVLLEEMQGEEETLSEEVQQEDAPEDNSADDHSEFAEKLIEQRLEEEGEIWLNNNPDDLREATLPNTGDARVLGFHVDFPDSQFVQEDDLTALQAAFGVSADGQTYDPLITTQYSDLHSYYERSSYGKLSISGDAYAYTAKKSRKAYRDEEELLMEVLAALDEEIDYSIYDANGDFIIDTVYLHVPYDETTEWGETWWPKCSYSSTDQAFDSCLPGSWIVISRNLTTERGLQTIIHETGHAIGFPDYYSYDRYSLHPDPSGLTGIQTFDMMNDDIGDHNGFSKWMAGWFDGSDITLVEVNENGVTALCDGNPAGTVGEDGSVTLDLGRFCTDTYNETGGIIVVGNNLTNGIFSTYYLIQYDSFAGNQKVYYSNIEDEEYENYPLPAGFRVFRVQAERLPYGDFKYTNAYGAIHNQLIELVDPDLDEYHESDQNVIPSVPTGGYGCMFTEGDLISPVTRPSTNLHETTGFSGIQIEFLRSAENGGTLKISYTTEGKPESRPVELEMVGNGLLPGQNQVALQANQKISGGNLSYPYVRIPPYNANIFYLRNVILRESTSRVEAELYLDADVLQNAQALKLNFLESSFYGEDGRPSDDIEMDLQVDPQLLQLTASGQYPDTLAISPDAVHFLTDIRKEQDATYYFYGYSNQYRGITNDTRIYRYSFSENTPEVLSAIELATGSEEEEMAKQLYNEHYAQQTENAAIVPDGAELGEFPVVCDAVKQGDNIYVLSARYANDDYLHVENELAFSKLDQNGKLISQILPLADLDKEAYNRNKCVRLQMGPKQTIALLFYSTYFYRDINSGDLQGYTYVQFFDPNLNLKGKTGGFSLGSGTWLDDGSYFLIGQRNEGLYVDGIQDETRKYSICYDRTEIIDPVAHDEVAIEGLALPKKMELAAGDGQKMNPEFMPENTTQTGLTWKSSDKSIAAVDEEGNVTALSRGKATITATSKADSKVKASCEVTVLFADATHENVSSGMFKAIYWVADKKITGEKVKFGTNNSMTRGQFVRFLYRYAGNPKVTNTMIKKYGSKFPDVDKNYTHFNAIIWAVSKGLIGGYSDGTFKPNKSLSRNNVATILWKYAGSPKVSNANNPFNDVAKSAALAWGKSRNIFTGTAFHPNDDCLRGTFAVFLYRYDKNAGK